MGKQGWSKSGAEEERRIASQLSSAAGNSDRWSLTVAAIWLESLASLADSVSGRLLVATVSVTAAWMLL